jgi:Actin-fragmin kinase, catalytic
MKWNRLKYVIRSEYGQDGVYFISDGQTKQVLKAPESPYSELYLTLLAHSFDLNIPEIKAICPDNQQYEEIIRYIKPEIEKSNIKLREAQKKEEQKNEYERDIELIEKRTLNLDSSPTFFLMENLKGRYAGTSLAKTF